MTRQDTLRMAIHSELAPYDPFNGPAYGHKNMPFAIAAGITAGAAMAAGGIASITAMGVLTVVAGTAVAAGLTMTIVGMATGDKKLMKLGGLIGLAGGLGYGAMSMAGAGIESTLSGIQEAATSEVADATTALSTAQTAGTGVAEASSNLADATQHLAALKATPNTAGGVLGGIFGQAPETTIGNPSVIGTNAITKAPVDYSITNGTKGSSLASSISNKITPQMPGATQIAGIATDTAKGAQGANTMFSGLFTPSTAMLGLGAAGQGISNYLTGNQANQLNQQNQAYNQKFNTYMANNANAIAPVNMSATPVTQAQLDAAQVLKAQQAKAIANTITGA